MHRDRDLDAVGGVELGEDAARCAPSPSRRSCGARPRSRRWTTRGRPRPRPRARGRSGTASRSPGVTVRRRAGVGDLADELLGDRSATASARPRRPADGVDDVGRRRVLEQEPVARPRRSARTTYSSASNVVSTITLGGDGDARQRGGGRDAVHDRHADVHQHDVDAAARTAATASRAVRRPRRRPRSSDEPPRIRAQPGPHERVVVGEQHADRHAGHGSHASRTNSPSGETRCVRRAPGQLGPLGQPDESEPRPAGASVPRPTRKRVAHLDADAVVGSTGDRHRDRACPGRACGRWSVPPARRGRPCGPSGSGTSSQRDRAAERRSRMPARASLARPERRGRSPTAAGARGRRRRARRAGCRAPRAARPWPGASCPG